MFICFPISRPLFCRKANYKKKGPVRYRRCGKHGETPEKWSTKGWFTLGWLMEIDGNCINCIMLRLFAGILKWFRKARSSECGCVIGSMVLPYMVTWIPSIYPSHVSINIPAPWILWVILHHKYHNPWIYEIIYGRVMGIYEFRILCGCFIGKSRQLLNFPNVGVATSR